MFRASIVQCLADVILLDVLRKTKQINDECREELKFELLQRVRSIRTSSFPFKDLS